MKIHAFIHALHWAMLPEAVRHQAHRSLLDTIGAGIGGRQLPLSAIIYDFVTLTYGGRGARLWFAGREVSPPGAALAHGMTIDALDIHDGFKPSKGHAGAGIVPATLASVTTHRHESLVSGAELMTRLVIGYEVALRAALALHATACDYHTSGAWVAVGSAAVMARALRLDEARTRHALGIAEYHGPRSPMMRCIDHPTMLKDGAGWGAMTGLTAALMADGGFTGAPALTVEAPAVTDIWADLGERWLLLEQYFKPYAVCYWAQAPIVAALRLKQTHQIQPAMIRRVQVFSFHEATRLTIQHPQNTEEAQYSLPFPVAAALVHDQVGPQQVSGPGLADPQVHALAERVTLLEEPAFSARFPAERLCRVVIDTTDDQRYESPVVEAPWSHAHPPSDQQLEDKFACLAADYLTVDRITMLAETLWRCATLRSATSLNDLLAAPAGRSL
jgi:2-methylcitrate dehydratase PrpD